MKGHNGIDFWTPVWTPVYACFDWYVKVINSGKKWYWLHIRLKGNKDDKWEQRYVLYWHLSDVSIKSGDYVKQGDIIGKTGNTGGSTWPHLHFEYRKYKDNQKLNANNGYCWAVDIFGKWWLLQRLISKL